MGKALYRKYRSRSFDEVVGQEHIIKTLKNALQNEKVSHAYLFTGPRGIGKTSVARILAHQINKLPYKEGGDSYLDIIEIDAASNRRIDEIRDLREKVNITPVSAKYKVYIIDEAHMLTREAFNALLKTLEEPPSHSVFILATTEFHKLPETIISRTQRYSFKPVSVVKIADHLHVIATQESIDIDHQALEVIAEHARGSIRDAISLLDQLSSYGSRIAVDDVHEMLGLPPQRMVEDLLKAVSEGKISTAHSLLTKLRDGGSDSSLVAESIVEIILANISKDGVLAWEKFLLKQLVNIKSSIDPQNWLDISVLEASTIARSGKVKLKINEDYSKPQITNAKKPESVSKAQKSESASIASGDDLFQWSEVLEKIKTTAVSLYGALRMARPSMKDNEILLTFEFALHRNKIAKAENLKVIEGVANEVFKQKVIIKCLLDKEAFNKSEFVEDAIPSSPVTSNNLEFISNIFGSAEIMEH